MVDEPHPGETAANAEQSKNPFGDNFGNAKPIADEPDRPATERLAAAEDKFLGADVDKHAGKPERGIGSRYHALHPAHKAHLAAIEHLITVEAEHAAAEAHLASVHARVEHAKARVESTEEVSDEVSAAAKVEKEPA